MSRPLSQVLKSCVAVSVVGPNLDILLPGPVTTLKNHVCHPSLADDDRAALTAGLETLPEQVGARFVEDRPVSAVTTQYLALLLRQAGPVGQVANCTHGFAVILA